MSTPLFTYPTFSSYILYIILLHIKHFLHPFRNKASHPYCPVEVALNRKVIL